MERKALFFAEHGQNLPVSVCYMYASPTTFINAQCMRVIASQHKLRAAIGSCQEHLIQATSDKHAMTAGACASEQTRL